MAPLSKSFTTGYCLCIIPQDDLSQEEFIPDVQCEYQAPDVCTTPTDVTMGTGVPPATVDLSVYPFNSVFRVDGTTGETVYELFWDFNTQSETISFAVRVRTTGWVGFGLSPMET